MLILSTAKYCTPNGKIIQDETLRKTGIVPDVQAPDDEKRQDLIVNPIMTNRMKLPNTGSFRKRSTKFRWIKPWKSCQKAMCP